MNRIRGLHSTLISIVFFSASVFAQSDLLQSANWTLKPHESNRDQFTLDIPDGWFAIDQTPYRETGIVAFYSQPLLMRMDDDPVIRAQQERQIMALAEELTSGAAPSFFVERYKAAKGMSCTGYSEPALKRKLKILANAPAHGKGAKAIGKPDVAVVDFAGCKGLRVAMRIDSPWSGSMQMLVYTAAVDGITYDFALITNTKYYEQNLPWFERVVATARLTAAN